MQFRWVAAIALWTVISAPIFAPPVTAPASLPERTVAGPPPRPSSRAHQPNAVIPAVFERDVDDP
jgi:hypothetical protein